MVLTQAEQEGYSVFVVRRTGKGTGEEGDMSEGEGWGDGGVGRLPECLADTMAVELGEPVGRTGGMGGGEFAVWAEVLCGRWRAGMYQSGQDVVRTRRDTRKFQQQVEPVLRHTGR